MQQTMYMYVALKQRIYGSCIRRIFFWETSVCRRHPLLLLLTHLTVDAAEPFPKNPIPHGAPVSNQSCNTDHML